MCRHLAYLGPPVAVADLCFRAPHGLRTQARSPRLQVYGDDNPDGWAVAWWADGALHEYRTTTPIWEDNRFDERPVSGAWMAAARFAAPGSQLDARAAAPLVAEEWMCSLNGIVEGFYDGVGERLRARCSPERRAALVTDSDTEVCFALILDRFAEDAEPADALAALIKELESETTGRFNFLVGDGRSIIATAVGNSLFVRRDPVVVASEPLDDDPAWEPVPDRSLVVADERAVQVRHL